MNWMQFKLPHISELRPGEFAVQMGGAEDCATRLDTTGTLWFHLASMGATGATGPSTSPISFTNFTVKFVPLDE